MLVKVRKGARAVEVLPEVPEDITKIVEVPANDAGPRRAPRELSQDSERSLARVARMVEESVRAHTLFLERSLPTLVRMAEVVTEAYRRGGKTLFLGNGGSAADAQHAAAELVGRFNFNRAPLAALSLATDTSVLTCIANDWDYDEVFSRQVRALARPGDVVLGLSTSGRSTNVARALAAARDAGALALAFTGAESRLVGAEASLVLNVPTAETPRIQELHILALHALCDLVEEALFGTAEHPAS